MNDPQLAAMIDEIPALRQRQDSLDEQLQDLSRVAIKLGMYDADDWLRQFLEPRARSRGCNWMEGK